MKVIHPARLRWSDDGQPWAEDFGDCYFSAVNGLAETRHVFLAGNHLRKRWQQLTADHFCIAETGFGSGLNFIAAWQLWEQVAPPFAHLYFVSTELHPLRKEELAKAAALWPELGTYYTPLMENYPVLSPGFHTLDFGRVTLLLMLGDATELFRQWMTTDHPAFQHDCHNKMNGKVDAWFLDGFAPAKNPALWAEALIDSIACLSKPQATLATFSAAGQMRRALQATGFTVEKQKGFGNKREMVTAVFMPRLQAQLTEPRHDKARFASSTCTAPWYLNRHATSITTKQVAVIGAGIAGCTVANALAQRGYAVTVIDALDKPAREASGNLQAVLYSKFSAGDDGFSRFNLATFLYALRYYRQLRKNHPTLPIHLCGMLQLAWSAREQQAQQALHDFFHHYPEIAQPVTQPEASALAGVPVDHAGLFFPQAGWIHPASICEHLLQHENIICQFGQQIDALHHEDNTWHLLHGSQTVLRSAQVIIANGQQSRRFEQTQHIPLHFIRGQVTHARPTAMSKQLATVVCGEGYIAPADSDVQTFGATYTPKTTHHDVTDDDHCVNLAHLATSTQVLREQWELQKGITGGRTQTRTATPDYFPLCGAVPVAERFREDFAPLGKNAQARICATGSYYPGLYLFSALGSRGMTYAPLCAEYLSRQVADNFSCLPRALAQQLNPARFVIRDLIKNKS
jgi:tRNA 5-methylaminomethyl-2-thiouridine biosynthesis bifunctional protein